MEFSLDFLYFFDCKYCFFSPRLKHISEEEREKDYTVFWSKYLFMLGLVVIVLNQFLKRAIITQYTNYIAGMIVALGFLTFFASRKKLEKNIENEKINEEQKERKRKKDFEYNFPRISKIGGLRSVVKWIYKEGWWYFGLLILIVLIGFILRIWNLNYLQGADNFNLLSAKALYQTGNFTYPRNLQITYTLAFLFKIFGATLAVARIPFVLIGTFSIFLIYFLGKFINKKIGLITAFLLAISPVAIEKSSYVREYTENFFWVLILAIIFIYIFIKYKDKPKKFFAIYLTTFILGIGSLYIYGNFVGNDTISGVLLVVGFITVPIFLYVIKQNYKKLFFPILVLSIIGFGFFIYFANKFSSIFTGGLLYNDYWFRMFFDPMVQFPMQWFSFSTISIIFIVGLFLLSFMIKKNRDIIFIMNIVFWSTILLFILKYYSSLGYYWSRYLYHLYPFYIVIFATGLFYFVYSTIISFKKISKIIIIFIIIFLLILVIIPQNTLHGANHDLSILSPINPDPRQPTTTGNANYFYNIFDLLEKNNFSNKDAIVIKGENQFFISWYFNYTINRTFENYNSGSVYDIGDKVYVIYPSYNINELDSAINQNNQGYLLSGSSYYGINNFTYKDTQFTYLENSEGYYLYKWTSQLNKSS